MMKTNYSILDALAKRHILLENTVDLLLWDSAVLMPQSGCYQRAKQVASITKIASDLFRSAKIKSLITACKAEKLSELQLKNLNLMEKLHTNAKIIPHKLQHDLDAATVICESIWRKAKAENNFRLWRPYITKVVKLTREVALRKADFYNISSYDALLDKFDQGITSHHLDKIFDEIKRDLLGNINRYKNSALARNDISIPNIAIDAQQKIIKEILQKIGFDFASGRIDSSTHPFCRGIKGDVRITIRNYEETSFLENLLSALHEAGHAMYIHNIDGSFENELVGVYKNTTIHESQSLFYECYIGKNYHFMDFLCSVINRHTKEKITTDLMYNLINKASINFIRTKADEYTYPLHIIHRYNIEKLLIDGSLNIEELPDIWNEEFKKLFGKAVTSHQEGCLQDIHWSVGCFGYFPSYLTGKVIASQIKYVMDKQLNIVNKTINETHLQDIKNWLNSNIHKWGGYYSSQELVQKICQESINPQYLLKYIHDKFL